MIKATTTSTAEAHLLWQRAFAARPELPKISGRFLARYFLHAARDLPWRKVEDPFLILLAEVMLQKTHSRVVSRVWSDLIERWPTPRRLSRARLTSLERVAQPLGILKRAARLRDLARMIVKLGPDAFSDYSKLRELPGVGKYTANAVLCQAFNRTVTMVDVNAARVNCRLYGVQAKTLRQALLFSELAADAAIRYAPAREVNLGVFDFAHAICRTTPLCPTCPMISFCEFGKLRRMGGRPSLVRLASGGVRAKQAGPYRGPQKHCKCEKVDLPGVPGGGTPGS